MYIMFIIIGSILLSIFIYCILYYFSKKPMFLIYMRCHRILLFQ